MPSRLGELEKLGRLGKEGKKQLLMPNPQSPIPKLKSCDIRKS
jgi:hypothetical protein